MKERGVLLGMLAARTIVGGVGCGGIKGIVTIVVICAENRSFGRQQAFTGNPGRLLHAAQSRRVRAQGTSPGVGRVHGYRGRTGSDPGADRASPERALRNRRSEGYRHAARLCHIADITAHLQQGPQSPHMLVIVTYDENGGFWDHVGPPQGNRWGPGSRMPTLTLSPYAKRGFVDHTLYDTTSILPLITKHYALPTLAGLKARYTASAANGSPQPNDLDGCARLAS
jgi:phospholipase C